MPSFVEIARNAAAIAGQIAPNDPSVRQAIVIGNLLPRMMVPAYKGIIGPREQNAVLTHDGLLTTTGSVGNEANGTINVPTHGDFLWTKLSVIESTTPASGTLDFELQIRFGRNDRLWVQGRQAGINPYSFVGDEAGPYPLSKAEYLPRNNVVNLVAKNLTANIRNVRVILFGIMVYDTNILDNTVDISA